MWVVVAVVNLNAQTIEISQWFDVSHCAVATGEDKMLKSQIFFLCLVFHYNGENWLVDLVLEANNIFVVALHNSWLVLFSPCSDVQTSSLLTGST